MSTIFEGIKYPLDENAIKLIIRLHEHEKLTTDAIARETGISKWVVELILNLEGF
jgi:hypothetical protein